MKYAVPPMAATARTPTMITDAMMMDTHVLRLLWLMVHFSRRASGQGCSPSFHQAASLVGGRRVIVALAERDRRLQFGSGSRPIPRLERQLSELEMRAPVDPLARFGAQRIPEVGFGLPRLAQRGPRGAALVLPERLLAEHPWPLVVGKPGEAFGQEALRLRGAAGAQARGAALQPHQAIPRVLLAQLCQRLQRIVIPLFAVVKQQQRES